MAVTAASAPVLVQAPAERPEPSHGFHMPAEVEARFVERSICPACRSPLHHDDKSTWCSSCDWVPQPPDAGQPA